MDDSRRLMRASQEFFLRSAALLARLYPSDLTRGLILIAINSGNTGHLMDDPELDRRYGGDVAVPDEHRRPVSRLAVANSLGIPYETARRHINALVADGWCVEISGRGVLIAAERLESQLMCGLRAENAVNLRRLLRRVGVEARQPAA
jgi:hypothetical protein